MPTFGDSGFWPRIGPGGWPGWERQDTGEFSSHNPASASFPPGSWLSILIFSSGPYALSFPASQDFLALLAVCAIAWCDWHRRSAPYAACEASHPPRTASLNIQSVQSARSCQRPHLRGLCSLNRLSGTGNLFHTNILKSRFEAANLSLLYPFT